MKSPLRTYKKLLTFDFFVLWGVGTDRRSVTPRPSVEGVDTRFTVVAGGHSGYRGLLDYWNMNVLT
jgi:hypothetical protein